jgi:superfamily II DNA/RNA helicase
MFVAIINQASALTIFHMLELLETQGAYTLKKFLERMESDQSKSHSRLMKEEHYRHLRTFLDGPCYIDHPKIDVLKEALYKQLQDSPDSRILVFTQYRDTAAHLVEQLNNVSGIKAERFVGQASKFQDRGLTQEQQASLIQDLRKGYLNTLVATSIAEEGLDIPEVDLVVFYEPIPSEIRYIQRKGRTGRRAAGSVIILAATNTNDMIYLYASSKRVERMKEISQKLNRILKPFLRLIPKPTPTPIPSEELSKLYSKTGSKPEPLLAYHEKEKLADMNKDVARAERLLYLRILEKGVLDIDNEVLYSEMEEEGYQKNIVATALKRLVKKKYLSSRAMTTSLQVKDLPSAKTMTITVERIFNGGAIVHIADKWRAKLLPEDYNGPRELIKKNNVFRALCELYNSEGILCVKVRQVTQTLR